MRLSTVLRVTGQTMMWIGAIVLLFVAYQLWGTGVAEARAQDDLASEFDELIEKYAVTATTVVTPTTTAPAPTTTTTVVAPPPADGDAVARIVIPDIDVDKVVVEGIGRSDLQRGPGHYPGTPLPGQPGNAAIAGHRTTYGAPFNRLDELDPGDQILVSTFQGVFTYEVTGTAIVAPTQVDVVADKGDDRLTLTSCHPKYSAAQRIVVSAELVDEPATPPPTTPPDPVADPDPAGPDDDEPVVVGSALFDHLDGADETTGSWGAALTWGAIALAVWVMFRLLARRWGAVKASLSGAPVFGGALWVFFGAVTELLPPNF